MLVTDALTHAQKWNGIVRTIDDNFNINIYNTLTNNNNNNNNTDNHNNIIKFLEDFSNFIIGIRLCLKSLQGIYIYIHLHTCVYIYTLIYVYIYVYILLYMCIYVCIIIYI